MGLLKSFIFSSLPLALHHRLGQGLQRLQRHHPQLVFYQVLALVHERALAS
jgi:hypothetical protein